MTEINWFNLQGRRTKFGKGGKNYFGQRARSARENFTPLGMNFFLPLGIIFQFFSLYIVRMAKSSGEGELRLCLMSTYNEQKKLEAIYI